MSELSKRDALYNEVLKTVKKHGEGMEIGAVTAVLGEVEGDIVRAKNNESLSTIFEKLKEKEPHEYKMYP